MNIQIKKKSSTFLYHFKNVFSVFYTSKTKIVIEISMRKSLIIHLQKRKNPEYIYPLCYIKLTHLAPSSSGSGDITLPLLAVLGVGAGGLALPGLSLETEFWSEGGLVSEWSTTVISTSGEGDAFLSLYNQTRNIRADDIH